MIGTRNWAPWLLFVIVFVACRSYGGTAVGDDTFIYLQYVRNVLAGHGYTFNAGEQSFGVTSPAWVFLMTPIAAVFGNGIETWRAASSALLAGGVAIVFAMGNRMGLSLPWALALAVIAALEPHTFRWSSSGMENGLLAFMLVSTAALHLKASDGADRRAACGFGISTGLLPFVRPELAILSFALLWTHRQSIALVAAAGSLVAGAALTYLAFGSLVPQTALAKAIALHQTDRLYGAKQAIVIILTGCAPLLALVAIVSRCRLTQWALASGATVAASIAYLSWVNQLVSTRYASYLCYPVVVSAVLLSATKLRQNHSALRLLLAAQAVAALAVMLYIFPATRASETTDIHHFSEKVKALRLLTPGSH